MPPYEDPNSRMIGHNPAGGPQQGAVLMVYGLNMEKINCDSLFNLFCLYGNVVRVSNRFLVAHSSICIQI